jgi:hypothetical protein
MSHMYCRCIIIISVPIFRLITVVSLRTVTLHTETLACAIISASGHSPRIATPHPANGQSYRTRLRRNSQRKHSTNIATDCCLSTRSTSPSQFTSGMFKIKHKFIINISNKGKHAIIMSGHLPCGTVHVLLIVIIAKILCSTTPM